MRRLSSSECRLLAQSGQSRQRNKMVAIGQERTNIKPPRRLEFRHRLLAASARRFYFRAAELGCKCICRCWTGEIPA